VARLIAFYLPQYHPIPENDEWWGKGFTEWTNVARAKPLYRGHYQPHVPADFGFYDLRVPETRVAQAELAKEHGIEAFCYYHYWFAGRRILERPFNEVLQSGQPDFPFCLCWANQTWTGVWHGCPDKILLEQTYPGYEDHQRHFEQLLPAFLDGRYVKVEGKPIFLIHMPREIPDVQKVLDFWRSMAVKAGLPGLHLVAALHKGDNAWNPQAAGFDAAVKQNLPLLRREMWVRWHQPITKFQHFYYKKRGQPTIYSYKEMLLSMLPGKDSLVETYPCLLPNWDNTPRSGTNGLVLHGSTPELFRVQVKRSLEIMENIPPEHKFIFIKSWNEWAEGNYLEPDMKFGKAYLEVIRDEVLRTTDTGLTFKCQIKKK
jgi:lipopolysaccharide biosynthesis protein